MLSVDGSYGEGGGQILRTVLSLAALTGVPVRIERIRARRSNPGLRPQHLTAVQAVARVCQAEVTGVSLGSQALTFQPRSVKGATTSLTWRKRPVAPEPSPWWPRPYCRL
jgi:RNA 3'-terminal phosphate cyclase (ATP)